MARLSLILAGVLVVLVPLVPFLLWDDALTAWWQNMANRPVGDGYFAGAAFLALAADIALPIPSSLVGTAAGTRLFWPVAVAVIWTGLTLGALAGFFLARWWGAALVMRLCSPADQARLTQLVKKNGVWALILTRPLPILAEATILICGAARLPWRQFLWPILWSHLGLAIVYATLGTVGASLRLDWLALVASVILPLLATYLARRYWQVAPDTTISYPEN
ncbi:MAG: VTT domain-containing protein [Pirellulales bacterium]|nr:VTT domain-containing protein [Pirellulales bacterium]